MPRGRRLLTPAAAGAPIGLNTGFVPAFKFSQASRWHFDRYVIVPAAPDYRLG
jgi:hypothetical protein